MNQIVKVVVVALLLLVSSAAVVSARPSGAESAAFALEGRPIEAVICHVDDDGSAEYVMVRSKSALKTHLEEHSADYRFGTKIGACEVGGSTPPGANASGSDAPGTGTPSTDTAATIRPLANGPGTQTAA